MNEFIVATLLILLGALLFPVVFSYILCRKEILTAKKFWPKLQHAKFTQFITDDYTSPFLESENFYWNYRDGHFSFQKDKLLLNTIATFSSIRGWYWWHKYTKWCKNNIKLGVNLTLHDYRTK